MATTQCHSEPGPLPAQGLLQPCTQSTRSTLAAALLSLAQTKAGGVLHVADRGSTTWHGFASVILEMARARGFPIKVDHVEAIPTSAYPTPAVRPSRSVLDTSRTEQLLGRRFPSWRVPLGV